MRKFGLVIALALAWVLVAIIVAAAVNIGANRIDTWLQKNPERYVDLGALTICWALLTLLAYLMQRRRGLPAEFDLYTTSEALKPEDVGFKTAKPGDVVAQPRRPLFSAYIPRVAISYGDRYRSEPAVVHSEEALVDMLQRGENLLLVGLPTEGKTRTLFEVVRRMRGYVVVRPKREGPPSDDAIALLAGKKVVCLLDDINSYAGTSIDLQDFYRRVVDKATSCVVAGATRDGPELETLRLRTTTLHQLYESLQRKMLLRRPSDDDRAYLLQLIGAVGDETITTLGSICMRGSYELMIERFGDLDETARACYRAIQLLAAGGVEPFTHVRIRQIMVRVFKRDISVDRLRECLAAMASQGFLLSEADTDPVNPEIAYFSPPAAGVFYFNDRPVDRDVPQLANALLELDDAYGLFLIAWACGVRNDKARSVEYYDTIVRQSGWLDNDKKIHIYLNSFLNKGITLEGMGRLEDATAVFRALIELQGRNPKAASREEFAFARVSLGSVLHRQGKFDEAIAVLDTLIDRENQTGRPEPPEAIAKALYGKGVVLRQLGRLEDAIVSYDAAIKCGEMALKLESRDRHARSDAVFERELDAPGLLLREVVAGALYSKAHALGDLGKLEAAIDTSDVLVMREMDAPELAMRTLVARALLGKSGWLGRQGRTEDVVTVCELLISREGEANDPELRSAVAHVLANKGRAFENLAQFARAIDVYDTLVQREGSAPGLVLQALVARASIDKVLVLEHVGRFNEVVPAYETLIKRYAHASELELREVVARAMYNKGVVLAQRGDREGGIVAYNTLIEREGEAQDVILRGPVALALLNKAVSLIHLDRVEEAIEAYDAVTKRESHAPESALRELVAQALAGIGVALAHLNRPEDAIATYDTLIEREGSATELALRGHVATALRDKGARLAHLGRFEDAIAAYDLLIERERQASEPLLRDEVAAALYNKGCALGEWGRPAEAISSYDMLVQREKGAVEPASRLRIAKAIVNRGIMFGRMGLFDDEIASYDIVIERESSAADWAMRERVATALDYKGRVLKELGRYDEASAAFDELIGREEHASESVLRGLVADAVEQKAVVIELAKSRDHDVSTS